MTRVAAFEHAWDGPMGVEPSCEHRHDEHRSTDTPMDVEAYCTRSDFSKWPLGVGTHLQLRTTHCPIRQIKRSECTLMVPYIVLRPLDVVVAPRLSLFRKRPPSEDMATAPLCIRAWSLGAILVCT
jgi:hypothetical protein